MQHGALRAFNIDFDELWVGQLAHLREFVDRYGPDVKFGSGGIVLMPDQTCGGVRSDAASSNS